MIDVEAIAAYSQVRGKPSRYVTVWDWRPAGKYARRDYDPVVRIERRCAQPVDCYDLCAKHADDKERLQ